MTGVYGGLLYRRDRPLMKWNNGNTGLEASKPELLKSVEYKLTYGVGEQQRTLPTNYDDERQVVKAYPSRTPLQLTLGVGDNSVEKAPSTRLLRKTVLA